MTINNKSERNYRGKCLGWPVTSYGGGHGQLSTVSLRSDWSESGLHDVLKRSNRASFIIKEQEQCK